MTNESVRLRFQQGSSDKVYNADLVQSPLGWSVNFAYGRRGSSLTTGSKTKIAVPYGTAKRVYDKLVRDKMGKGYLPSGATNSAINVAQTGRTSSGILPQLLNEMTEEEAEEYITNDDYCMQEKYDGRRRLVHRSPGVITTGINKKGQTLPLTTEIAEAALLLGSDFTVDGEDMGEKIMLFDDITTPELAYRERYEALKLRVSEDNECFEVVHTAFTTQAKRGFMARLKRERAEGVVFKNVWAPYKAGRPASGGGQYKCKFYDTASCIVSSISAVKNSIGIQVFDEYGNSVDVGNTTVYANSPDLKVGDIVEIKYLYYNEGGSLYQPVLKDIRDDVDPSECTLAKLKRKKDEQEADH